MKPSLDRAEMPARIRMLPVNDAGYPVPWFVATIDGKPDFRVIERGRIQYALTNPVCWVCGGIRGPGEPAAFVIGPMCAVNRTTAEPPSHVDCAEYSATHCPFLRGGWLFDVGAAIDARWFAEGRPASRDEVLASIESGLPLLRDMAVEEGPDALAALMNMHAAAMDLVPA